LNLTRILMLGYTDTRTSVSGLNTKIYPDNLSGDLSLKNVLKIIYSVFLISFCTLFQSVSGQDFVADSDSLLRENRLLHEQLEHLQARGEAFRWRRFPDGPLLRSGTAIQVAPGPASSLAFATDGQGLVLYNGTRFEVYSSANSNIPDDFVTATALFDDQLWIGTATGLAALRVDGLIEQPANLPVELAGGTVSCLLSTADSTLWAGTQGAGLWQFDGGNWQQFTSPDTTGPGDINALAPAPDGGVWAATAGEGIWRVIGGKLAKYPQPLGPGSDEVYSVLTDRDALVWIGTVGAGAGFWDGFGWQSAPLPVPDGTGVVSIAQLQGGDLFFGTTQGAWLYIRAGNDWEKLPLPEEIAASPIVSAAEHMDRLWLAPSGSGIYFLDRGLATRFSSSSGLGSESVYQINQSADGRMWFSTFDGVATYDGHRWSRLDRRSGLPDNLVTFTLFGAGDTTMFATHRGAGILSGQGWKYLNRNLGLGSNTINHLALDSRDGLWLSTEGGGLTRVFGDSLQTFTTDDGLPAGQVQASLPVSGDSVWVATKRGLALIAKGKVVDFQATAATDETLLPSAHYTALLLGSQNELWVASNGDGAWNREQSGRWHEYRVENGLGSNEVFSLSALPDGRTLFGTQAGLSIFDGLDWRNLGTEDGLNPGAVRNIFVDSGGALWLASERGGVLKFDPGRLEFPETFLHTPSGALTAQAPDGKPAHLLRADSSALGRLMLGNNRYTTAVNGQARADTVHSDRLSLSVFAVTPWWNTPQSDFTFQWRLDNGPWSDHASGGAINVFDLSRGDHLLQVRARGPYLRLDPTAATYSFFVDIPTLLGDWRFWAAAILLLCTAGAIWQRRRLQWWLSTIRHRHFRPVTPNPFNPNAPQTEKERFCGRGELLERLKGLLEGGEHGSVIIHGGERIGMTSFLIQCQTLAGQKGGRTAYLDLATSSITDVDQLATRMATELTHGETLDSVNETAPPLEKLSGLLETSAEPVVLIIDNAELLGRLMQRDRARGERLVTMMRETVLKDSAAAFIFGTGALDSFREGAKTLFEMSRLYRLGPVSDDEAAAILTRPLMGKAVIHEKALKLLSTLSGGQPYILQWLGRELVEVINAGQNSLVTPSWRRPPLNGWWPTRRCYCWTGGRNCQGVKNLYWQQCTKSGRKATAEEWQLEIFALCWPAMGSRWLWKNWPNPPPTCRDRDW
jgi:ligand-binding sensor domain-containing protein